jgi:uncharacterized protein (DUF2164 family)
MKVNLPKETKEKMVQKIQEYFIFERSEEIGELGAQILMDFMLTEIGPYIYNQGVKDAKIVVEQKMGNIEEDLYSLEIPIHLLKRD